MEISDRIYLLIKDKQYRGDVPSEVGELKILNKDTLVTLNYWDDKYESRRMADFWAHGDGYFENFNHRKFKRDQQNIDPDGRFFRKTLNIMKGCVFRENSYSGPIPEHSLKEEITVDIIIDRYKNTISGTVDYSEQYSEFLFKCNLKKVTLFN
tara:strand:- start:29 stop:487 length:459 start_codon:yes stop_codon:yes gene_type:complete